MQTTDGTGRAPNPIEIISSRTSDYEINLKAKSYDYLFFDTTDGKPSLAVSAALPHITQKVIVNDSP